MTPEEREKIVNVIINAVDCVDVADCHLSDYQRKIIEDFAKDDYIVAVGHRIGKSWIDVLMWLKYMYICVNGVTPTYDELSKFAHSVLTDSYDVETETSVLSFSINIPKERTIADVKKDIKHEKNPMRLKQLNKELNKLYRENKRKKKGEENV
jgi:hypothetical protein